MGRKPSKGAGSPVSIRLADDLQTKLETAAFSLEMSVHDTMRLAMKIGLKHFQKINYDLAGAVSAQVEALEKIEPRTVIQGQITEPSVSLVQMQDHLEATKARMEAIQKRSGQRKA